MTFVTTILERLERAPDQPFVTEVRGGTLIPTTGRGLRAMVEQARAALRARGIQPRARVVLVAPNSSRWVALDLALLAEGITVVPLYARQAAAELSTVIADADPALVIGSDEVLNALETAAPKVALDQLFSGDSRASSERAPVALEPHDIATIIYTSGSSGDQKGVMTKVGGIDFIIDRLHPRISELTNHQDPVRDRVFHYLPLCFAGSRMMLWATLSRGAGIMLSTSLDDLVRELQTASPHYFLNVPALLERVRGGIEKRLKERGLESIYRPLIERWRRARSGDGTLLDRLVLALAKRTLFAMIRKQIGPNLLGLCCGSAPLYEETQGWFIELVGIPVYQSYGLTETTAIVTFDERGKIIPGRVGAPLDGVQLELSDEGEVLVSGPNIFAGYFRRDEATREAFDAEGRFKTGDLGELEQGNLRVVGRVKNLLVPISGHNVAPEPLESSLAERIPSASHVVVFGHARPYLTALIAGAVDERKVEAAIESLNASLPHYRRIRKFFVEPTPLTIESGLLTANQKLRRRAIETHFADRLNALYGQVEA